jgi:hypothetical protein
MTDTEKVARLAVILGIEGAVQYGRFRGYGERSHKRGHREARLGEYAGDGETDASALNSLACRLERHAEYLPASIRNEAHNLQSQARSWRQTEASARAKAEGYELDARKREATADAMAEQYAAYLADRGTEGES